MITAKVDTRGLNRMLSTLEAKDIPKAARNTLKDLMRDTVARERREIERVFDRPTALVKNGVRITKTPTTKDLTGAIGIKHNNPRADAALNKALKPHIPGFRSARRHKGLERALQRAGMLKSGQYLVPSRSMRLDRFGNVSKANIQRMAKDVLGRGTAKQDRFVWATVHGKGGDVSGIWIRSRIGKGSALAMLAVDSTPTYSKRFRFEQVAIRWADKRAPYFARKTVDYYITRKYGGNN